MNKRKNWNWGRVYGPYAIRWIKAYYECLVEARPVSKLEDVWTTAQGRLF